MFAELEIVLNVLVGCSEDFEGELVERVVKSVARPNRTPRVSTFHLSAYAAGFGLLAKCFFLGLVFQLQQQALSL